MLDPIQANIHILYALQTSRNPMVGEGEKEHWLKWVIRHYVLIESDSDELLSLLDISCTTLLIDGPNKDS